MKTTDISKQYANGIGHIETRGDSLLVSYYGPCGVSQDTATTVKEARSTLSRLVKEQDAKQRERVSVRIAVSMKALPTVDALATEFAKQLHAELGAKDIARIVRENMMRRAMGDADSCASHDFCDANMLMLDAWSVLTGGRSPRINDDKHCAIITAAWTAAKMSGFSMGAR